jgi:hypothetical protein
MIVIVQNSDERYSSTYTSIVLSLVMFPSVGGKTRTGAALKFFWTGMISQTNSG